MFVGDIDPLLPNDTLRNDELEFSVGVSFFFLRPRSKLPLPLPIRFVKLGLLSSGAGGVIVLTDVGILQFN